MPNKYLNKKGIDIKPQKYRVQNWAWFKKGNFTEQKASDIIPVVW